MKKLTFVLAICLLALTGCAEKSVDLLALEGTTVKDGKSSVAETTKSYVKVINNGNGSKTFALLPGVNDWTPYKALRWTVENKSTYPLSLWVRVIEKNAKPGSLASKANMVSDYNKNNK